MKIHHYSTYYRVLTCLLIAALALPSFAFAQEQQERGLVPTKPKTEQTQAEGARGQRPELVLQTGVTEPAAVLTFSPDGRLLATAGFSSQAVKVWEMATGRELLTLNASGNQMGAYVPLADLAFSADGKTLLSFVSGTLREWEVETGKQVRSLTLFPGASGLETARLSPDGRWAAHWKSDKRELRVWQTATGQQAHVVQLPPLEQDERSTEINSFTFSPDGRWLATSETARDRMNELEGQLVLRDAATGKVAQTFRLTETSYRKDNEKAMKEQQKAMLDAMRGKSSTAAINQAGIKSVTPRRSLRFTPDGRTLVLVVRDLVSNAPSEIKVRLFDSSNGRELRTFNVGAAAAAHNSMDEGPTENSFALSPDGNQLLIAGNDASVKLLETASGRALVNLTGYSVEIVSTAFSGNGRLIATASVDSTIRIHDISQTATSGRAELVRSLGRAGMPVNSLAVTAEGRALAVGGTQAVNLWELPTGVATRTLTLPATQPRTRNELGETSTANVFSADGKFFAAPSGTNTVKIWETRTGREVRQLPLSAGQTLASLALNRDASLLAVNEAPPLASLISGVPAAQPDPAAATSTPQPQMPLGFPPLRNGKMDKKQMEQMRKQAEEMQNKQDELEKLAQNGQMGKVMELAGQMLANMGLGGMMPGAQRNGGIRLLDVSQGNERFKVTTKSYLASFNQNRAAAFSADGRLLATALNGYEIKLNEAASGREVVTLPIERGFTIQQLAFSNDAPLKLAAVCMETKPGMNALGATSDFSNFYSYKLRVWEVPGNGGAAREVRVVDLNSWSDALAFSPDGRLVAVGSEKVQVFELASGRAVLSLPGHALMINALAFSPDGKLLISGSAEGSTKLWNAQTGELLATLVSANAGSDWLVVTPDGLFDGTPGAWQQILWRFSPNIYDVTPVEVYFNEFFYPGLLAELYAGNRPRVAQAIELKDRRQPVVSLKLAEPQSANARTVKVRIEVNEPTTGTTPAASLAGARDVRLFRNGTLVKAWRGDVLKGQRQAVLETTLPIVAGENRLMAYAFNRDNIKSTDAVLTVTGAEALRRKGTAYVVAFGVNRYANEQYSLKYAVADAQSFADEVRAQQTKLQQYERVEVISLFDQDATKANLLLALQRLSATGANAAPPANAPATLAKLQPAQPEDAVLLFFAGHGTAAGARFYLIPHDLGYSGARDNLDEKALQTVLAHSISDLELEAALEGLDAGQLLFVIDACNSGQALEAEEKRRGPMNSKGLAQLAYEKGMSILTAAQSYQAALEAAQLGHGYLTFSLVEEGLKKGLADRADKDGQIVTREWFDYATERVPQMQEGENQARGLQKKKLLVFTPGEEKIAEPAQRSVQRPRVFYRREGEAKPLVVARP
jgi:WD40 repeat protein